MAIRLEITLNDDGRVNVNGPIDNKILCWGLLTAASEVIKAYDPEEHSLVELPPIDLGTGQ